MPTSLELLRQTIAEYDARLRALSDAAASSNLRGDQSWSCKQELGHLLDSATNNRVRFVRAALDGQFDGPSYDGRGWVDLGGYADMPWTDLVDLWRRMNLALAAVVERIPESKLSAPCRIGGKPAVTLGFVIQDYVDHMRHHLDHVVLQGGGQ